MPGKVTIQERAERVRRVYADVPYREVCGVEPTGNGLLSIDERQIVLAYLADNPADDDELIADCYATDPANWRDPWLLSVGFRDDSDGNDFLFINAGNAALHDLQAMAAGPWWLARWLPVRGGWRDGCRPKTRGDVRRLCKALGIPLKESP